jgi:hypothetical protein
VINGRFRGMEISGAKAAVRCARARARARPQRTLLHCGHPHPPPTTGQVDANAPATPDSRLLSQLKRIPTSLMDLSTMSSNPGSNTSLSELGSR